jgi:two-component system sensor histidine kinase KdpD
MDETLTLANELGAVVFTVKGADVVESLLDFAHRYRIGNIIVGKPETALWHRWSKGARIVERLMETKGLSVQVVDTSEGLSPARTRERRSPAPAPGGGLGGLLTVNQVLILKRPVRHGDLLRSLASAALEGSGLSPAVAAAAVMERERRGSTFLNSGLALAHASLEGLAAPRMALALPRGGLEESTFTGQPETVFFLLSPRNEEKLHLETLSAIGRAFQDASLRSALRVAQTPEQVLYALDSASGFNSMDPVRPPL